MSFSVENLGFNRGDALPQAILAPPPTFPPLLTQPLPLTSDDVTSHVLTVRQQLLHWWNNSPFFVQQSETKADRVARYSDRHANKPGSKPVAVNIYDNFKVLPSELRVDVPLSAKRTRKHSRSHGEKNAKLSTPSDKLVVDKLNTLEECEKVQKKQSEAVEDNEEEDETARNTDEDSDGDDEMDCGNDYVNDYFDNGESYLDAEDDALEEGPVF